MSRARKTAPSGPRAADVARWVAILAAPVVVGHWREENMDRATREDAAHKLGVWGLGADGLPRRAVAS